MIIIAGDELVDAQERENFNGHRCASSPRHGQRIADNQKRQWAQQPRPRETRYLLVGTDP